MNKLNKTEMEDLEGGSGLGCASAIVTTVGVTLGATAITSGVGLAVWLVAKAGSLGTALDACR